MFASADFKDLQKDGEGENTHTMPGCVNQTWHTPSVHHCRVEKLTKSLSVLQYGQLNKHDTEGTARCLTSFIHQILVSAPVGMN